MRAPTPPLQAGVPGLPKDSLSRPDASLAVFNVVDDEPAPAHSVNLLACRLTGTPPPPVVRYEAAESGMSAMARSFYGDSKRVSNRRIKLVLGVRLAYPTYREGLRACLEEERTGLPPASSALHGADPKLLSAAKACSLATAVPQSVRRPAKGGGEKGKGAGGGPSKRGGTGKGAAPAASPPAFPSLAILSEADLLEIRREIDTPSTRPDTLGGVRAPYVLLVDNGSIRAAAHLQLRALARRLEVGLGGAASVIACSARHSNRVPAAAMSDGKAPSLFGQALYGCLRAQVALDREDGGADKARRRAAGVPAVVVLPLFFGPSKTVTDFLPSQVAEAAEALRATGRIADPADVRKDVRIARPLVDLSILARAEVAVKDSATGQEGDKVPSPEEPVVEVPSGVSHLAHVMRANVGVAMLGAAGAAAGAGTGAAAGGGGAAAGAPSAPPGDDAIASSRASDVLLVEHGSPSRAVNDVRAALAVGLQLAIRSSAPVGARAPPVTGCAMERREGKRFDFCEPMLEAVVAQKAEREGPGGDGEDKGAVVLAMQFALPGKHAGAGGDVSDIVEEALRAVAVRPGQQRLQVLTSPLASEHPAVVDLLVSRLCEACSWIEAPPVRPRVAS